MESPNTPMSCSFSYSHCRKTSGGELDVFEATRYFSGMIIDARQVACRQAMGGGRRMPDMPINKDKVRPHVAPKLKEKIMDMCKQPSSSGKKLASFINSFFQQYTYVFKKKKMMASKLVKSTSEKEESKRRNISNTQTIIDSKSCYYSSSCSAINGFMRIQSLKYSKKKRSSQGSNSDGDHQCCVDGDESDSSSDLFDLKINLYI